MGKRQASAKAKAKVKAPTPVKRPLDESLVASSEAAVLKRRACAESIEDKVMTALYNNFQGWSEYDMHVKVHNGLMLFQRMCADRQRAASGETIAIGLHYYTAIKSEYSQSDAPYSRIKAEDDTMPVQDALRDAIQAMFLSQRNMSALHDWLQTAAKCNQKELSGLLRGILKLPPHSSGAQATTIVACLKYMTRTGLHTDRLHQWEVTKHHFDSAMCTLYGLHKKANLPMQTFYDLHKSAIASLLGGTSDIEAIFAERGQWASVTEQVLRVTGSCSLGSRMAGFAVIHVRSAQLASAFGQCIKDLKKGDITAETLMVARKYMMTTLEGFDSTRSLAGKREIEISYRGLPLSLVVSDGSQEVRLRLGAHIREVALQQKINPLPEMIGERFFSRTVVPMQECSAELYADIIVARCTAQGMIETSEIAGGSSIREAIMKKRHFLISQEPTWLLEEAYIDYATGILGRKEVQAKILECFLAADRRMLVDTTCTRLQAIRKDPAHGIMCAEARSDVSIAISLVDQYRMGFPPVAVEMKAATNFHTHVVNTLVWFCTVASDNDEQLHGDAALKHIFKTCDAYNEDEDELDMPMLTDLHRLGHLLTGDERARVAELTKFKLGSTRLPSSSACAASCAGPGSVKAKAASKESAVRSMVEDLFS